MSKALKGKEVWQALLDGKKITRLNGEQSFKYIFMSDYGYVVDENNEPFTAGDGLVEVTHNEWKNYEEEEPLVEYAPSERLHLSANSEIHTYQLSEVFYLKDSMKWHEALFTFMRLKAHPLARKISNDLYQYLIFLDNYGQICIEAYMRSIGKITEISPCFDSEEEVLQVIKDVGEENIINMFKVFGGVK